MGVLTEQIQSLGYHFIEGRPLRSVPKDDGFQQIFELRVRASDGQTVVVKCNTDPTLFPGGMALRDGVLDRTLQDGIRTTNDSIYRDYYDMDENGYCLLLFNSSARTRAYLDSEKIRIGLIDYKEGLPEGFFALDRYPIQRVIGDVDVGRYADGRYVAQTARGLFEETHVLRMHYSRFPSRQDVEDTLTIRKIERDFASGRHKEVFHCDDCGELRHWLDIPGSLQDKLRMRLARRCGCAAS